uniref:MMS19 nucleotide excision repair protein n=1 Tax=Anthurium amnicola TaxID=1678845 RepID=A0A1D1Z4H7_9ARAE
MAKAISWIRHVEAFVDSSHPSEQQNASLNAIAELVKNDLLSIEGLVRELELYLTTTDNIIRARGILLLAEILAQLLSKPLDIASIHFLIGFFTSRLADWQALRGALVGCLALLRRKSDVGMVAGNDARLLAQSFLQNIQVQSLAFHDRKQCFELLQCLLEVYPEDVATLGENLVHGICEAIDEEKDPRCLVHSFQLVETLARLFPDPSGPVASYARELFDVLSCYFPVYFIHPKIDDFGIQREDLSQALMHAFCSTPFFGQFSIPLLLDKLSSSLPLAKLDSLKYLGSCIVCYGANRMSQHAKPVWLSLKDVIFNFPQEPFTSVSESIGDSESQSYQIGREALNCLRTAISLFNNSDGDFFASLIIEDEDVEIAFSSVTCEESYEGMSIESQHKLIAVGSVLCELVKVSSSCCNRVIKRFFPLLMGTLGIPVNGSSSFCDTTVDRRVNFRALYLSVELVSSCRDLAVSAQDHSSELVVHDEWCSLLQSFSTPLAHALGLLVKCSISGAANEKIGVRGLSCGVKGLQMLATFPKGSLQLSKALYDGILMRFMTILTGSFGDNSLWKLALEALLQIGMFIEKYHDSEKQTSYVNIVVEKILTLHQLVDSAMPLELTLEAVYSIGTTTTEFMMRAIQEVEKAIFSSFLDIFFEGEIKARKTIVQLLDFYSGQVLAWCKTTGHFEEVGMHFVLFIWNQMERDADFKIGLEEKAIHDAIMMTMKLIVAGCGVEHQAMIVQKAYRIFLSNKSFPLEELKFSSIKVEGFKLAPDIASLSSKDELFISLFASVLIALSPETLIPDAILTLKMLMLFLLKGYVPAAQALGSLVNKWSSHAITKQTSSVLEDALKLVVEKGLLEIIDGLLKEHLLDVGQACATDAFFNNRQILIHALVGVSWIGKGLLMRGHEEMEEVMMLILKCLLSADTMKPVHFEENLGNGNKEDMRLLVARCAADALHVLLSDSKDCLNRMFHATLRPLYKQRFFSSVMPTLLSAIKSCKSPITRSSLYRAFGHVIADTPLAAVITEAKKVIPFLLDAISVLSLDNLNKDLIYSLLLVLSGMVMDEKGRETIIESAHTVINHVMGLISYPHMMLVRETAVQCLFAMSELPHARIYPLRPQVLRAVSRALDDPKRPVRLEAVKCRQAWASIASRSLHY